MSNLLTPGAVTSNVEVTHISPYGLWLLFDEKEYFLPYDEFPWFRNASVAQIISVVELTPGHLYWPELDVDLTIESIEQPERFPLKAKTSIPAS